MDELLERLVAAAERSAMLLEDMHNTLEELSTEVANIREAMPEDAPAARTMPDYVARRPT